VVPPGGAIYFPSALYESSFDFEILAYEFDPFSGDANVSPRLASPAHRKALQYRREIAAHVRAVDVLVRVERISERDALTRIASSSRSMPATFSTVVLRQNGSGSLGRIPKS
jgi:hypothetical protein